MNKVYSIRSVSVSLSCLLALSCSANKPPPDDVVAAMLRDHEAIFSQIEQMLHEEPRVREIASWGIRVADSSAASVPPNADMSLDRYQKYHALLAAAHALAASRPGAAPVDACVLVWAAGWFAEMRHVSICWRDEASPVASNSGATGATPYTRETTYSLIKDHWYVQRD